MVCQQLANFLKTISTVQKIIYTILMVLATTSFDVHICHFAEEIKITTAILKRKYL
jgi:hypothetical protein